MNWKAFENKFHISWREKMKPFIESEECNKIYAYLKDASRRGDVLSPQSSLTYRAFIQTPLNGLKCVILGGHPFDTIMDYSPISTGVYLDNSLKKQQTPQMNNFIRGLEIEMFNGMSLDYEDEFNVDYLCKQGVLMLNTPLTTNNLYTREHEDLWKPFIEYLLKNIINKKVPILLLGNYAQTFKDCVKDTHNVFVLEEPSKTVGVEWSTNHVFEKIDEILENTRGMGGGIQWLNIKNDVPY